MAYNYQKEGESNRYQVPGRRDGEAGYSSVGHTDPPPNYSSVGQHNPPAYAPSGGSQYNPQPQYGAPSSYAPGSQWKPEHFTQAQQAQAQYAAQTRDTYQSNQTKREDTSLEILGDWTDNIEHQPHRYQHDKEKRAFLRKVYLILLSQLTLTTFVSCVCMYVEFVRVFCLQNIWLFWFGIILSFVFLIAMFWKHDTYPTNIYLLFGFTLVESYIIGVVCAIYVAVGQQTAVLQAFLLTIVITVSLTVFTIQSSINFSFLRGFLFAMLWVLIAFFIINMIFGFQMQFLISLVGAIVFSLFIVFDTYRIWKSNEFDHEYGYIDASISLYLDIINLFLCLLTVFSSDSG
eukprot:542116_1